MTVAPLPMDSALRRAPERDPAWLSRLFWIVALLVVLWPLAVATEFRPWVLLERDNLKISAQFIGSFWPLAHSGEFLAMVARDTWRTVAMATAGVTLALLLAIPLTLLSTRVLSVSALSGRMARGPFWLRQAVRWLLIVLRSIPELVWALVFVRVVGLGPTAGVLAIALTYGGMLGKVYGEILESGEHHATEALLRNGSRPPAGLLSTGCCRPMRRTDELHGVPLGVRDPLVGGAGFCGRRRPGADDGQRR
jgi:phosphonate transport system permease protein